MSDIMTPMPISQLVEWVMKEKKESGSVFGVYRAYKAKADCQRMIFGRHLETPIGPAAGPHTQLAQNIIASYFGGSRFFELKTVQIMDGAELSACVKKPCIQADDECYNVEWSTELYVPQAQDEYIKAWFIVSVLAKEFALGAMDGFQFNMSVGYDLEGIKSEKIDTFLNNMMEAKETDVFKQCKQYFLDNLDKFDNVTKADIENVSSNVCNSVTLSTLHGCPPQEIERIANYLLEEKGLHTFIKCNPTLLGYEYARKTMDAMGYDYVQFGEFHFQDDLQYEDAIPMLHRLIKIGADKQLEFGVKITNTFPVDIKQNELPGEEMYMSGKSLYPLSMAVASKLSKDFDGKLRISYSGGADYYNIKAIVEAGIWPVTIATTLLKPGGYQRLEQLAEETADVNMVFGGVSVAKTEAMVKNAFTDPHHVKPVKPLPQRKSKTQVPLVDCFMAPCQEGCPIHQDITEYVELAEAGQFEQALQVILEKNPLPFITGTICPHNCMNKCTRNFYEEPVHIRDTKLLSAQKGYEQVLSKVSKVVTQRSEKVAVVGGGPSGLAAAYFLKRSGADVTIFERSNELGGIVNHVIPDFRIKKEDIQKDIELLLATGVEVELNTEVKSIKDLQDKGYTHIIWAVGAQKAGMIELPGCEPMNAQVFLAEFKKQPSSLHLGENVVIIGGGNTAMDTARAAKRVPGVKNVYLVYRRNKRFMPADEEELLMAVEGGVQFKELLAPKSVANGQLTCSVMELGEYDSSGRRGVSDTGREAMVPADTVIVAVGEQVDLADLEANQIQVGPRGKAQVNTDTLESSQKGVFVIGDGLNGPATVVEGIRDAIKAASAITGSSVTKDVAEEKEAGKYYQKRGILASYDGKDKADDRCLGCETVCENCVEVCPNRANISIHVPELEKTQVIHVDSMCNECGNCKSFCPYDSSPYLDKFTLFANEEDMKDSKNQGFAVIDSDKLQCKVRYLGNEFIWEKGQDNQMPQELGQIMEAVCKNYRYLWY